MKNSEYIDSFVTHMLVSEVAQNRKLFLEIRGALTNSFIVYLLWISKVNPLHAHYYCNRCGHFEVSNKAVFGIDLPAKKCPCCINTSLKTNGFSLELELA